MERKLIKLEYDNYVLEEILINTKILFYKKDNTIINSSSNSNDMEALALLYHKYTFKKIVLNDPVIINDTIFNYQNNKVIVSLISFKNKSRHLTMQ